MSLSGFILRRVAAIILLLFVVSVLVFIGCEVLPGDVAQVALGMFATPENVAALRTQLGLDQPALLRYAHWLGGLLFQGDWGMSIVSRQPVTMMIGERLGNTALLAAVTTVIAVPLAVGLGIVMAITNGGWIDRGLTMVVLALSATPEFLVAAILVLVFALHLNWLPTISYLSPGASLTDTARALVLPAGTLTLVVAAQIARMTRSILTNVLSYPYIEMAMLKGLPVRRLVARHALVNAVGPIANVVALNVAYMVSGIVVVETIFAYPGLARLMIDAVQSRDFPLIQACALIFCAAYVVLILIADVVARLCDPRAARGRG